MEEGRQVGLCRKEGWIGVAGDRIIEMALLLLYRLRACLASTEEVATIPL